jgi:hypothetical protein
MSLLDRQPWKSWMFGDNFRVFNESACNFDIKHGEEL